MLPEDKEFEDLVKSLKPASSNNPFSDRTNSGFKTNIVRIIFSNTRCGLVEPSLFASLFKLLQ